MSDRNVPSGADAAFPMFPRAALARVLPFLVYIGFIVLADGATRLGIDPQQLRWLYAVKIGAVLLTLFHFRHDYTELRGGRPGVLWMLLAIASGLLVFVLWIQLDAGWMQIGTSDGFNPTNAGRIDWLMVAVRLAGAALVVPLMEELFWRSFLMRWIDQANFESVDPGQVKLKSVAITVVLFGFEHNLWFAGVVAGAVYSCLYMRHKTLWSAILAHGITNAVLGLWIVRGGHWSYW